MKINRRHVVSTGSGLFKRCDSCKKLKKGVKRKRLFFDMDDAVARRNGHYFYLCRKCYRECISR